MKQQRVIRRIFITDGNVMKRKHKKLISYEVLYNRYGQIVLKKAFKFKGFYFAQRQI